MSGSNGPGCSTSGHCSRATAGQDRREDALALAEEARAIAEANGAQGVLRQIDEARAQL